MAINVVPVNAGGSGSFAPQQGQPRTPQVRQAIHPGGAGGWETASKVIDKNLPGLMKIFQNKATIEALQKAMGPKPDGSSKLTDMAYKIMEAGKSTNNPQLYSQGVSMLQKQEGREYGRGQYEAKRDEGRGYSEERLGESREYSEGLYTGRRDEKRSYSEDRTQESRRYSEVQRNKNREEARAYSEKQYEKKRDEGRSYSEKIRKENREYGEDLYGKRRDEGREYSEEQYRSKTEDSRDYKEQVYKDHRDENRGYNKRVYDDRLEKRTETNSAILKEKREYAWEVFEKKRGYKIDDATKLRQIKRDEKKALDDAKRDEKRAYQEKQSDIKFNRSHPHDFGPGVGRLTPPQAYKMWKDANDLASEMELDILKSLDPIGYEKEKEKISKAEADFPKWVNKRVAQGKENAKPVSPITDPSKFKDLSPTDFDALYKK
jgi:hypothetical protein